MRRCIKKTLAVLALLAVSNIIPSAAGDVGLATYDCHDPSGVCLGYVCDYDSVKWDNLTVTVEPGALAGQYLVDSANAVTYPQVARIFVESDGSYGVDLDTYLGGDYWRGYGPNAVGRIWWVDLGNAPQGARAAVEAEAAHLVGGPCTGYNSGVLRHGSVHVTIIASQVADQGQTKECDANTGCSGCQSPSGPMASYWIHLMLVSLHIEDTPISYNSPRGPSTNFKVAYNQREANQPTSFAYSNFGPKWTFNWLSYVTDDGPSTVSANPTVYVRGGGTETYGGFNSGTQTYVADKQTLAVLARISGTTYEKQFPDGSKEIFSVSDGASSYPRRVFLSSVVDAAGNATTLAYDGTFRITAITDSLGQAITFAYQLSGDPLKITKVTDPFGRFATFAYTGGKLSKIIDPIGIESQFGYAGGSDFINSMTTPYGTTTFATGETGNSVRWVEVTDPRGGQERVEYNSYTESIPASETAAPAGVSNNKLRYQNTFYWDKKAMAEAPGDYTKAKLFHWLSTGDGKVSGIKHSEKKPLESRVWYTYEGQTDLSKVGTTALPTKVARILDDGTTQLSQHEYNGLGNVTKTTDPSGRAFTNVYATNEIDVLEKRQTRGTNNELLASFTYNSLHKALTSTDSANQTTTYTYNSNGQVLTIQNAKGETTTYAYGPAPNVPAGYLASITSPVFGGNSAVTNFTYDGSNRVRTVTNSPDNYTVTTDYDALDRPTKKTHPDTTFEEFKYTDNVTSAMTLDLTGTRDRRGRWTYRHYNGNRQMDSIKDPLNRETLYGWCTCGSLTSITDPRGKTTTFNRDLQSRVTSKVFHDTTSISYVYENTTSQLKSMTDALNQTTNYQYFADDNLKEVSYSNAIHSTPTVSFTYDPDYNRAATMTDGTGTTSYSYYPITSTPALGAGQLQTVDGPLANDAITYTYDELGRTISRSIDGVASSVTYDSLGRLDTNDNVLGHFSRAYDGVTARLQTFNYPNGQTANYTYFDNSKDRRLQRLQDLSSVSANISKFDYVNYDAEGQIKNWTKTLGSSLSGNSYMYDAADQLTRDTNESGKLIRITDYGYDSAGNRTADGSSTYSINDVNEITNAGYSHDLNGNMTSDGVRVLEWDAANRLTAIVYPGTAGRSEFTYDGLSRRVKMVEKDGSALVLRQSNFVWDGQTIAEERNGAGTVMRRFSREGVQVPGNSSPNAKLFYSQDHLGSTRSITNENGTLLGLLEYDAYGNISRRAPDNSKTSGPKLTGAVSRLTHGSAATFDVTLVPFSGSPGIEMRNSSGNYALVLTFDRLVLSGTAVIASGIGTLNGLPSFVGNTVTVQLSGVADRQTIVLELDNVVGVPGLTNKVLVAMSVLVGDVNQDGVVTVEDIDLVKSFVGATADATSFKYDINANGFVTGSDVNVDKTMHTQGASLFPEFAFTGHYYHARSGLSLTLYRAYSPALGRWISRDPIGEQTFKVMPMTNGYCGSKGLIKGRPGEMMVGSNLYKYVENDPINLNDPLGLSAHAAGCSRENSVCISDCLGDCPINQGQTNPQYEVCIRWCDVMYKLCLAGERPIRFPPQLNPPSSDPWTTPGFDPWRPFGPGSMKPTNP